MAGLSRDGNHLRIYNLADSAVVSEFAHALNDIIALGYDDVEIAMDCEGIFPNCAVPVAAMMHGLVSRNIEVRIGDLTDYAERCQIRDPVSISHARSANILSHLWKFSENDDTSAFMTTLRETLSENVLFAPDVLYGLEWALNEVMDNVLVHSSETTGYVMVQVHRSAEHRPVAICVSDLGIGLRNSLSSAYPKIRTDYDAITAAIRQGVTRDKSIGQGNGLWGLSRIVAFNRGRLSIRSGGSQLNLNPESASTRQNQQSRCQFLGFERPGTTIDFQVQTNRAINVRQVLELQTVVNYRLEAICDEKEFLQVHVAHEGGTGTRSAGERLRNKILNNVTAGAKGVVLDFSDVGVVTSSFADELLGKMILTLGFIQFNQMVRLQNLDDLTSQVIQRSVFQRVSSAGNEDI